METEDQEWPQAFGVDHTLYTMRQYGCIVWSRISASLYTIIYVDKIQDLWLVTIVVAGCFLVLFERSIFFLINFPDWENKRAFYVDQNVLFSLLVIQ